MLHSNLSQEALYAIGGLLQKTRPLGFFCSSFHFTQGSLVAPLGCLAAKRWPGGGNSPSQKPQINESNPPIVNVDIDGKYEKYFAYRSPDNYWEIFKLSRVAGSNIVNGFFFKEDANRQKITTDTVHVSATPANISGKLSMQCFNIIFTYTLTYSKSIVQTYAAYVLDGGNKLVISDLEYTKQKAQQP